MNRSAVVLFHDSASPRFEHVALTRFKTASAKFVDGDSGIRAGPGHA